MNDGKTIEKILNVARWAPSGDNTQPWRFELLGDNRFRVHAHDTRDWCVYDLEGHASQIAVGALLETIALAASAAGLEASFEFDQDAPETSPLIDVELLAGKGISPDPLADFIERRVTQRRPFSSKPLTKTDKKELEGAVGEGYRVIWIDEAKRKRKMARLLFRNAGIRLTIKEAYQVHKRIIEWDARFSDDRIPDRAIGLDPLALKAMKWAMGSWERVHFLNRFLGGTLLPRLQMDVLPALGCAAHFLLVADRAPKDLASYTNAGRAVQRLWLTCTGCDIQFQPEVTPIIFADYVRNNIGFTSDESALREARKLLVELSELVGDANVEHAVFAGRVGYGKVPDARSVRLPLERLLLR